MKCPRCGSELIAGKVHKKGDGTEYFELRCPKCKSRFMDLKIPHFSSGFQENIAEQTRGS